MTHHTAISPDPKPQVLQAFDRKATLLVPPASAAAGADSHLPPAESAGGVINQARPLPMSFLAGIAVGLVLMAAFLLTKAPITLQINLEADTVALILVAWTKQAKNNQPASSSRSVNQPRKGEDLT
jgi:hypothetical protein